MSVKLENWTTLSLFLPWGNIKNYFFTFSWSWGNASQRHHMVVNRNEQLDEALWEWIMAICWNWSTSHERWAKSPQQYSSTQDTCQYELSQMTLLSLSPSTSVDRVPAQCSGGHGHHSCRGRSCHVAQFTFYKTWWYANMRKIVLSGRIVEVYLAFALGCKSTTYIFWTI